MAKEDQQLNLEIIRSRRVRAICHQAVDYDHNNKPHDVRLKTSKEFLAAFNKTALAILLRAMDSACQHGRTTIRLSDLPTLKDMGLDEPEEIGVDMQNMSLIG
jgi:hypothetical protein